MVDDFQELKTTNRRQFERLIEPHQAALQAHCYRMLGSLEDAEDQVQETFLRAWKSRKSFEGRASLRTWLYRIATNACLDYLEHRSRRDLRRSLPHIRGLPADPDRPHVPISPEISWLEPYPQARINALPDEPEARYSQRESIRLAFLVALQRLPPRQRAVLLLRDVMAWRSKEVAEQLEMSISAVNSALYRARRTLQEQEFDRDRVGTDTDLILDTRTRQTLDRYVEAWQAADVRQLVSLLTADARFEMPPSPSWYQGVQGIETFLQSTLFEKTAIQRWRLRPVGVNNQHGFGLYEFAPEEGLYRPSAVQALKLAGGKILTITTFVTPQLFPHFDLAPEVRSGT